MENLQVVILCGGRGTRLQEETGSKPKPLVTIGDHPILWHIMKTYAHYGARRFVLCLGYLGTMIQRYFHEYRLYTQDSTVRLASGDLTYHGGVPAEDWEVTLADTGADAMTGCRVKRVEKYVTSDLFCLTYGDGVCDVDVADLVAFHRSHGKVATVTGVFPASRFGELVVDGDQVTSFQEKPEQVGSGRWINGGYFVFDRRFFGYLSDAEDCVLEQAPLSRLAAEGELAVYRHHGFWQCVDTLRDLEGLRARWRAGDAPWMVWR